MLGIERILCPTDLSSESDEALRYAVALTCAYKAIDFDAYSRRTVKRFEYRFRGKTCEGIRDTPTRRSRNELITRPVDTDRYAPNRSQLSARSAALFIESVVGLRTMA